MGGSVAGLLAAWVLRNHANRVTVVERDVAHPEPIPRRAIPQGHHVHALLRGGAQALEGLLPGLGAELVEAGAVPIDFAGQCRFFHYGVRKPQFASPFQGTMQTRPLVEACIRRRVMSHASISVCDETKVAGLQLDPSRRSVCGVTLESKRGSRSTMPTDLVVDASGRGSLLPGWLDRLGFPSPATQRLNLDLTYASRWYRPGPERRDWSALFVYPRQPGERRGGFIFPAENDRWLVTLVGYGDAPPKRVQGFEAFAQHLPRPDLYRALHTARGCSPVARLRVPDQMWRRYDRVRGLPQGLVVMGDAHCYLDPLFGQGMTLCALEAQALEQCLAQRRWRPGPSRESWGRTFHARCARLLRTPWRLTSMEALRYPSVDGHRSPAVRALQAYAAQIFTLSASNPDVYARFLSVLHMVAPLPTLFSPRIVARVALHALRGLGPRAIQVGQPGGVRAGTERST